MHRLLRLRQPLAEDEAVQPPEHQALWAAGRARNHADVLRPQAPLFDVLARRRPRIDPQGAHGGYLRCSLAKAPAIAVFICGVGGRWPQPVPS